ncbi:MAG: iron-sulfur cluster assembly scaffold protein [Gammaproteobacteria bacterium]
MTDAPNATTNSRRGSLPYSDVIRERWRRPRFRGQLEGANAVAEDVNPLCGDRVRLMLRVADERVQAARFIGDSCAICTAASDVLAEMVEGRGRLEALAVGAPDLLEALAADIRPTRMRCVTLPLHVLAAALGNRS